MVIENNSNVLTNRVLYIYDVIPLDSTFFQFQIGILTENDTVILTIVKEVDPPS